VLRPVAAASAADADDVITAVVTDVDAVGAAFVVASIVQRTFL